MPRDRDVRQYDDRSDGYEGGWRGALHHRIADRSTDIALGCAPSPKHILDIGCGTGYQLHQLAEKCPDADELAGIDPAPGMIEAASRASDRSRVRFSMGVAEHLPYSNDIFDLIVTTTSFDHWENQRAGLAECARVLAPSGYLVLTDRISALLLPTTVLGHRGRARTIRKVNNLLTAEGFQSPTWHNLSGITVLGGLLIRTATTTKKVIA